MSEERSTPITELDAQLFSTMQRANEVFTHASEEHKGKVEFDISGMTDDAEILIVKFISSNRCQAIEASQSKRLPHTTPSEARTMILFSNQPDLTTFFLKTQLIRHSQVKQHDTLNLIMYITAQYGWNNRRIDSLVSDMPLDINPIDKGNRILDYICEAPIAPLPPPGVSKLTLLQNPDIIRE